MNVPHSRSAAKQLESRFYFTGLSCSSGHTAMRRTANGVCVDCSKIIGETYRNKHRDKRRAKEREVYYANHEKSLAEAAAYRARNLEKIAAYRKANAERDRAAWLAKYHANREHYQAIQKAYNSRNPLLHRVRLARRRARLLSVGGKHTAKDIVDLLKQQRGKCAYCKNVVRYKYHVDHIMPVSLGGDNDRSNLQILCPGCNQSKHASHPIEFAKRLGLLL